ncbi:MAG: bifunctional hydroxymethylpyrimidine kinase/phosphomethylpyrimidine kinase, partial [Deltaproteobacteria bacterium]|nr:bifunctional hydroxymethylpyrimidine kinase/phosphomethylpyrimidine kinase [Deltaproteobacteria bacterium]
MIDDFKKIIAGFKGKRVLVAGDLMLDEYIWCRSGRISPEAPAPVLDAIKSELMPGGSGNTAVNIISLGGIPLPVGVIGRDNAGREVIKALEHRGVSTSCIIEDSGRQTTRKTRIIANYRYMARIDSEDRKSLSKKTKEGIVRYLERLIPTVDAVIISDYRKGFVEEIVAQAAISLAGKEGIPVCVDSKAVDYSIFRGATVITPNNDEAAGAAGNHIRDEESLIRAGKMLLQAAGVEYVLIKRANKGMTLFL